MNTILQKNQRKQRGIFLAMPIFGLAIILGLGGTIIATHDSSPTEHSEELLSPEVDTE